MSFAYHFQTSSQSTSCKHVKKNDWTCLHIDVFSQRVEVSADLCVCETLRKIEFIFPPLTPKPPTQHVSCNATLTCLLIQTVFLSLQRTLRQTRTILTHCSPRVSLCPTPHTQPANTLSLQLFTSVPLLIYFSLRGRPIIR